MFELLTIQFRSNFRLDHIHTKRLTHSQNYIDRKLVDHDLDSLRWCATQ